MVIPIQYPDDIIRSVFSVLELETFTDYLEKYLKKRPEWDEYRSKIPEELLLKWARVLKACKSNGFLFRDIREDKMRWWQIRTDARTVKSVDKCTLCSNDFISGTCKGLLKLINSQRTFISCWQMHTKAGG